MAHIPVYLDFETAVTLANTYGQRKTKAPAVRQLALELTNLPIRLLSDVAGDGLYFRFFIRHSHAVEETAKMKNIAEYVRPCNAEMVIAPSVMDLLGITGENGQADNSVIDENLQACYLMAYEGANLVIFENGLAEELAAMPADYGLLIAQEGDQLKCSLVGGVNRPSLAILEQEEEKQQDDAEDQAIDAALELLQSPESVEEGLAALRQAAEKGNPRAQWELGLVYLQGEAVPQDTEQGALWVAKSAENGYELARQVLSQVGGDEQEITETGDALISLAERGDLAAQIKLGSAYLHGTDGVEKDIEQGVLWLERAAESDNAALQQQLAMLLLEMEEEEASYHARGLAWLKRAGENGLQDAAHTYAFLSYADELKARGDIPEDAGFEAIMEALKSLAAQGDSRAAELIK